MQRTRRNEKLSQKKASAILTGDWHLREDTPTCFQGDFQEEQWRAVDAIAELQRKHGCVVIHSGDLFNHWKPSPYLLTQAIKHLPERFYTIYGNHDLPQHNLELADKCGINVLKEAGRLEVLSECHWEHFPDKGSLLFPPNILQLSKGYDKDIIIVIWHVMTWHGKRPWPTCTDPMAASLLRKYPQYDLIVTGHNHKTFTEEYEGRLLINPGSITRQAADQINHVPGVFLWFADTNTFEWHKLPYTEGAISREHIEATEQRDARIDAFISRLDGEWDVGMSFEQNLEAFFQTNTVRQSVRDIIYKAIE